MLGRKSSSIARQVLLHTRLSSTQSSWDHDVLICGGGVVGALLAADLLKKSEGYLNIGIIEAQPPKQKIKDASELPDIRVYALSPHSVGLLDEVGAWKYINTRSQPYSVMQVWEEAGPGLVRFSSNDMGAAELGRICEDQTIQSALYKTINDRKGQVTTYFGAQVSDVSLPANMDNPDTCATVTLKSADKSQPDTILKTRLLVGADGGNSVVRRLSGTSTWGWGYEQEAVVATVRLQGFEPGQEVPLGVSLQNNTAWQKYLPTGPLALLPLWNGLSSIVWSTSVQDAKRLKALSNEQLLAELNAALQTPPASDKWSVFEKTDATSLPPFMERILKATEGIATPTGINPLKIVQRAKQEVAALADVFMATAQVRDPLRIPPMLSAVVSPRVSFPLSFAQASRYSAPRCALIGDAAHTIHPQAGQGLNLGILDAATLSDCIIQSMKVGGDIGGGLLLKQYERERYNKNLTMMSIVDRINAFFKDSTILPSSSNVRAEHAESASERHAKRGPDSLNPPQKAKQFIRSMGMLGVHQLGPIKNQIAKFAMGLQKPNK